MTEVDIDGLVANVFCAQDSPYGGYRIPGRSGRAKGSPLLAGHAYRYQLINRDRRTVIAHFYLGVSNVGEELWRQELRVLQRVASLGHPALPQLHKGGYIEEHLTKPYHIAGCAFVVTEPVGQMRQLYDENDPRYGGRPGLNLVIEEDLQPNLPEMIAQFMSLADALSVLHDMGIVHRNIWPGTVGQAETDDGRVQMMLTRFEMSRLVSNLLRSTLLDANERAAQARKLIVDQGPDALAYFSPERIRFMVVEGAGLEDHRSDIYGLGMVVAEWLVGPIPDDLLARVRDAMADGAPDADALLTAARAVNQYLVDGLRGQPDPLVELLRAMVAWDKPANRPTATDVVTKLSDHYEALTVNGTASDRPHLLVFMPDECRKTLLKWKVIDRDPSTPEGREETKEFIAADLRNARIVHMPNGAEPFMRGPDPEKLRAADQVLLGNNMAWFCRPWAPDLGRGRLGEPDSRGLLAAFVLDLDGSRGRGLQTAVNRAHKQRWIPPLELVASDIDRDEMADELAERPSWTPLLAAVRRDAPQTKNERDYADAFDWLMQFQRTELESRIYPYRAEGAGELDRVRLRFDEERDRRWRHSSPMATCFTNDKQLRPPMGDFFAAAGDEEGFVSVTLHSDEDGTAARHTSLILDCTGGRGETVQVLAGKRTTRVPETGWIRLTDDVGSWVALNRQEQHSKELLANRVLLDQLASPSAITPPVLTQRSTGAQVAEAMSRTEPLFALQGPPGTGKTEVASEAVVRFLEEEAGARVLVSTQSNFALDNIAERLLRKLGLLSSHDSVRTATTDVVAVRATSVRGKNRVDELIKPFLLHDLAERKQDDMAASAQKLLAGGDDETRALLTDWIAIVRASLPELIDRLQRAANLVFVTCSSATPATLTQSAAAETFDLVVIEEAAKAWPTELAIPLSRGTRWALVGDHRQLPAHRKQTVVRFLDSCVTSVDEDLRVHGERREDYLRVFDLFGNLFADGPTRAEHSPRHTLRTQYRMRPDICEIVSRAFYPVVEAGKDGHVDINAEGMLHTGRDDTALLRRPTALARRAVVWLDTAEMVDCAEQPAWCNPGEVSVVRSLLRALHPVPQPGCDNFGDHPLAVLAPYRRQVELFRQYDETRDHVSTIHAFQGREANVVVVSLVRDHAHPDTAERPWVNIGHLNEPELVNVLFSRAREHLVLVGSFRHFRDHGGPMWADVCALVERFGTVVPAASVEEV